jgi:hypothetical protein
MPLDGLRAWIGEVERKLGMRTRVFLVLATIAIGGAGAAIYLALDTRDTAVSESDVRALQEDLEAQIAAGGATAGGSSVSELESQLRALEAEVDQLRGEVPGAEGGGSSRRPGSSGTGAGALPDGTGNGVDALPEGTGGAVAPGPEIRSDDKP